MLFQYLRAFSLFLYLVWTYKLVRWELESDKQKFDIERSC